MMNAMNNDRLRGYLQDSQAPILKRAKKTSEKETSDQKNGFCETSLHDEESGKETS